MFSRRPFTLIEVLIAFSLAAVLISTLMNIYWQVSVIHRESDEVRRRAFEVRYLQSRLADVLPKAIAPIAKGDKSLDFFFYTPTEIGAAGKSLVFSYDNGIDIDPFFSNTVLGKLFVAEEDGRKQVWLITWPIPRCSDDPSKLRKELLFDGLDDWKIEFFATIEMSHPTRSQTPAGQARPAATPESTPIGSQPQGTQGAVYLPKPGWQEIWDIRYKRLPAMVRVRIKSTPERGKPQASSAGLVDLFYMLPNSDTPVFIY